MIQFGDKNATNVQMPEDDYGTGSVNPDFFKTYDDVTGKRLGRLLDGGCIDNTAAAYALSSMQRQGELSDGFTLSLFLNNTDSLRQDGALVRGLDDSYQYLPTDLASIFGLNEYGRPETSDTVIHSASGLPTINPHVFNSDSLAGVELEPAWRHKRRDLMIKYFELDVQTVGNKFFDIPGDIEGKVHLWIANHRSSDAIPFRQRIHNDYGRNYAEYRKGIADNGGWTYLADSFGL